ncbi:MAG: adenylate/guanylate cyclase domain-containing protein [bacterium]|nr:adenylate/guanylate cyclase domain-containing protein [bacterium]
MDTPVTQYARTKDVYIAYQVFGDAPQDLIFIPGFIFHMDLQWDEPSLAQFNRDLAKHFRMIMFDKRGTGLSDRHGNAPTFEERIEDIEAVMEATGSKKAAIFANSESGPIALLMAATFPERVSHLIIFGSFAKGSGAPDYPWMPKSGYETFIDTLVNNWGKPETLAPWAPDHVDDTFLVEWWGRAVRSAGSPGMVRNLMRMMGNVDVRDILPSVRVPTMIIHRKGDKMANIENGRYLAAHIPNAKMVELEGNSHLWWLDDYNAIIDAAVGFIKSNETPITSPTQRILSTILFTDIVDSTKKASQLGDTAWRKMIERHDAIVKKEIKAHRGTWIKSTGDGCLATFDSPSRALRCAESLHRLMGALGIQIRVGLHTGECELINNDITGIAVNIAARLLNHADNGAIACTETVKSLVIGSGFTFEDKGKHTLKGVEGEWQVYRCHV